MDVLLELDVERLDLPTKRRIRRLAGDVSLKHDLVISFLLVDRAMLITPGYAAMAAGSPMEPFTFSRRDVGPQDVLIQIRYCGMCHSDLHQVRDEWGGSVFPLVPGHEIVGTVKQVGPGVNALQWVTQPESDALSIPAATAILAEADWSNIVRRTASIPTTVRKRTGRRARTAATPSDCGG